MRRNVKNDKVLRAITIGLATMIAVTSTPVTVFATDGDGQGEGENVGLSGENDKKDETKPASEKTESQIIVEVSEEVEEVRKSADADADTAKTGAAATIDTAKASVKTASGETGETIPEDNAAHDLYQDLLDGEGAVDNIKTDLGTLEDTIDYFQTIGNNVVGTNATHTGVMDYVNAAGEKIKVEYEQDENGNLVPATDDEGNAIYAKDADGNPIQATDALGNPIFLKDADGNLVQDTDEFGSPKFVLDENNELKPVYVPVYAPLYRIKSVNIIDANETDESKKDKAALTSGSADSAVSNADIANNSDDEDEAKQARDDAGADLTAAENGLQAVSDLVKGAEEDVKYARQAYKEEKQKADEAKEEADNLAKQLLAGIIKDSVAAKASLDAAYEKAETLADNAETALNDLSQKELLLKIQEKNKAVVEHVAERKKLAEQNPETAWKDYTYWSLTEELCEMILTYYLNCEGLSNVSVGKEYKGKNGAGEDVFELLGFQVQLIQYTENGDAYDNNGIPWQDYKQVTTDYTIDPNERGYVHSNNNCDNFVVVKYVDGDGKQQEKYYNFKANEEDGSIYFFERTYSIDEEVVGKVDGQAKQEAQDAVDDWYVDGDTKKDSLSSNYNEANNNLDQVKTKENGDVVVPNFTDSRPSDDYLNYLSEDPKKIDVDLEDIFEGQYSKTKTNVKNGSEYTKYVLGTTYVEQTDKKTSGTADLKDLIRGQGDIHTQINNAVNSVDVNDGYKVRITYHTRGLLGQDIVYDVDKDHSLQSFWDETLGINNWGANLFGTAKYTVTVYKEDEGIIKETWQNYDVVSAESYNKFGAAGGFGSDAAKRDLNNKLTGDLNGLGITYVDGTKHYEVTLNNGTKRTVDITVGSLTGWDYEYKVSWTDEKIIESNKKVQVGSNAYGGTTYTHVKKDKVEEKQEVVGHSGYTNQTGITWVGDGTKINEAIASKYLVPRGNSSSYTNKIDYLEEIAKLEELQNAKLNYSNAKADVETAQGAVNTLKTKIDNLAIKLFGKEIPDLSETILSADMKGKSDEEITNFIVNTILSEYDVVVNYDTSKLTELAQDLEKANDKLIVAKNEEYRLGLKVAAAQEAVEGIDLSRFNRGTIPGATNHRINDFSGGDDEDVTPSSTTPGSGSFVTYTTPENEFTLVPLGAGGMGAGAGAAAQGRAVASNRAADRSGVLGVRTDETEGTKNVVVDTTKKDNSASSDKKDSKGSKDTNKQKLVKVENNLVPLADTPFEEGAGMNWAWLLAAAAAAGAGAYGYGKHKKAVAANEEMKKYKK